MENKCWNCEEEINGYHYSVEIFMKDGSSIVEEEVLVGMTDKDLEDYEEEIKEKDKSVERVEFGVYCPHCLAPL